MAADLFDWFAEGGDLCGPGAEVGSRVREGRHRNVRCVSAERWKHVSLRCEVTAVAGEAGDAFEAVPGQAAAIVAVDSLERLGPSGQCSCEPEVMIGAPEWDGRCGEGVADSLCHETAESESLSGVCEHRHVRSVLLDGPARDDLGR
jgi:hypothetical protein